MDVTTVGEVHHNATDKASVSEEERIETLSIIVWCVGGVLLISLLSLLARIILAKKKHFWDEYEHFDYSPSQYGGRRVLIDSRGRVIDQRSLPRDRSLFIYNNEMAPPDQHFGARTQVQCYTQDINQYSTCAPGPHSSSRESEIITRQLRVGEYVNSLPSPGAQTTNILASDETGSRATLNGVVISPPSYHDVIDPSNHIPSLVVDQHNQSNTQRHPRQMFSL